MEVTGLRQRRGGGIKAKLNKLVEGFSIYAPPRRPAVQNQVRGRRRVLVRRLFTKLIWMFVLDVVIGCIVYIFCYLMDHGSFGGKTTHFIVDAFYFSSTTLTTTGFGDLTPVSDLAKILTSLYIPINSVYMNFYIYPLFGHIFQLVEGTGFTTQTRLIVGTVYALSSIVIGVPCLICFGGFGWGNAFYTVIVSFSSTGFGDYSFGNMWARIFGSIWLQLSHLVNCRFCGLVAEAGDEYLVQEFGILSNSSLAKTDASETAAPLAHTDAPETAARPTQTDASETAAPLAHTDASETAARPTQTDASETAARPTQTDASETTAQELQVPVASQNDDQKTTAEAHIKYLQTQLEDSRARATKLETDLKLAQDEAKYLQTQWGHSQTAAIGLQRELDAAKKEADEVADDRMQQIYSLQAKVNQVPIALTSGFMLGLTLRRVSEEIALGNARNLLNEARAKSIISGLILVQILRREIAGMLEPNELE